MPVDQRNQGAERAAFEHWRNHEDTERDPFGDYADSITQMQWSAWRARAAIASVIDNNAS